MPSAKSVALLLTLAASNAFAEPAPSAAGDAPPDAEQPAHALAPTPVPPPTSETGPAPSPPAIPASVARKAPLAGSAQIRFAVNRPNAWLEARPFGAGEEWRRRLKAPGGEWVHVEGEELRVTAEGMTPSGPFRVEPGHGAALLTVNGGSSSARALGRLGLSIGVPLSLVGMGAFGYGHFDERRGLETAGIITLAAGAALVLVALPLLVSGGTSVRNAQGDLIATSTRDAHAL